MQRIGWIDWVKAWGILLVVVAHAQFKWPVGYWITAFVMPLFFAVSGYLFPPGSFTLPWPRFFRGRLRKLLLAYVFFAIIGSLHVILISQIGDDRIPPGPLALERMAAILFASATVGEPYQLYPNVLWYFPALVSGLLLLYAVHRLLPPRAHWPAVVLLTVAGFGLGHLALPWELETGLIAALFIQAGHALRTHPRAEQAIAATPALAASLLLAAGTALVFANDGIDFRSSMLWNPFLEYPAAFLICLGTIRIAMGLRPMKAVSLVAEATILIFPVHILVFWAFDRAAERLLGIPETEAGTLYRLVKTGFTFAALAAAYPLFCRLFPWLVGGGRTAPAPLSTTPPPEPDSLPQPAMPKPD